MSYLDDVTYVLDDVRAELKKNFGYPDTMIEYYFDEHLEAEYFDGSTVRFLTKSVFRANEINNKYIDDFTKAFSNVLGYPVDVSVKFDGDPEEVHQRIMRQVMGLPPVPSLKEKEEMAKKEEEEKKKNGFIGGTLPPFNFEYTFDNFIVGNSNKFAHAACWAVAERPALDYNPLFIYGPSGLGKTHLLYAITNAFKKKNPNANVIYIKSEDFTNQLIESLAKSKMPEFKEKYRSCDMLLIDDIQFIAGKVSTQEEFFHTFNALFEAGKQIILTSDRPPRDIRTLEERLKTRFEWGLIADIQPPDMELRIAIIKKKAEQVNITLSDEVLNFLAENLRSNIRQIEGAIKKLGARSFLMGAGHEISMDLAKGCLSELLGGAEPASVTIDKIFTAIYKKYNVKKEDIIGARRTKEIAAARHKAIYLVRTITEMSLPNIGKIFNRDHSTIMSSIEAVEKKLITDAILGVEIDDMIKEVTG